jgi:CarD family transcriptional regulator
MYKAGDHVVYKNNGICVIEDVRKEKFVAQDKQDYYVLKLLYTEDARIYVPVLREESEHKMRAPITKQEAEGVVKEYKNAEEFWVYDDKLRTAKFRDILDGADPMALARLLKSLTKKSTELLNVGKRLRVSDESVLKKAEANT